MCLTTRQVTQLEDGDIRSVALTKENVRADPEIWNKLERAEYRLVYASPEILLNKKSPFKKIMTGRNKFKDNLAAIAVDEAHSVWNTNGGYRKEYNQIGSMRAYFPKVPWVALSATIPPHVMTRCQNVCQMTIPSNVVTCKGRRTNINIMVIQKPSAKSIQPLLDLIPDDLDNIDGIPKSLVFVDSCRAARDIARQMRGRLRQVLPSANSHNAIRTYYSSIDDAKKEETHTLLRNSKARLVICTDSMSLGVNISDIERVIQWGVCNKLDLKTLVQRMGRAARDPELQALAVIYAPKSLLLKALKYPVTDFTTNHLPETFGPPDDELWEDEDENPQPTINRNLACFSLPVTQTLREMVRRFQLQMYRKAKASNISAGVQTRGTRSRSTAVRTPRRKPTDTIDPALLWFLNTTGCRHRCILSYLNYPDVFDDHAQKSWCCDNCAFAAGLDPEKNIIVGFSLQSSIVFGSNSKLPPRTATARRLPNSHFPIPATMSLLAQEDARAWRKDLYDKLVSRQVLPTTFPEDIVVPDEILDKIVTAFLKSRTIPDLADAFQFAGFDISSSILRSKDISDLFTYLNWRFESESRYPAPPDQPKPPGDTPHTPPAPPAIGESATTLDSALPETNTSVPPLSLPVALPQNKRQPIPQEGGTKKRRRPLTELKVNEQSLQVPSPSAPKMKTARKQHVDSTDSFKKTAGKTITKQSQVNRSTKLLHDSCSLSGGSQRHLRYAGCDIAKVSNELRFQRGQRIIKASQKLIEGKGN